MKFNGTNFKSERQSKAYVQAKRLAERGQALTKEVAKYDDSKYDETPGKDQVLLSGVRSGLEFDSRVYTWHVRFDHAHSETSTGKNLRCEITEEPVMKSGFMPALFSAPMPDRRSEAIVQSDDQGTTITEKYDLRKESVTLDQDGNITEFKKYFAGIRVPV